MNILQALKELRDALAHAESVYRLNVVKDGEPSSTLQNMQAVLAATAYVDALAGKPSVDYQTAIDSIYPVPDSPHASVLQRAHDNRIAFSFGWQMANALAELAAGASWTPASAPPDADTTVMLALTDGEVWQGYYDGTDWIEVSGLRLVSGRVKFWQHTPAHPETQP